MLSMLLLSTKTRRHTIARNFNRNFEKTNYTLHTLNLKRTHCGTLYNNYACTLRHSPQQEAQKTPWTVGQCFFQYYPHQEDNMLQLSKKLEFYTLPTFEYFTFNFTHIFQICKSPQILHNFVISFFLIRIIKKTPQYTIIIRYILFSGYN